MPVAFEFTVDVPRFAQANASRFLTILSEEMQAASLQGAERIQTLAQTLAPVAFGALRDDILVDTIPAAYPILGGAHVFTGDRTLGYARPVEFGSRPHWVSVRHLQAWADLKGINVYAVRWSIATKGTRPQPFFNPAVEAIFGQLPQLLTEGLSRAIYRMHFAA